MHRNNFGFMLKDILKQLILLKQNEIPYPVIERDESLPVSPNMIITIPGVRRSGKSSRMQLVINKLVASGLDKKKILWIGFDDERLANMGVENLDLVIEAYRELYPIVDLKGIYMFFDEIQIIDGWELFVVRLFKSYCKNLYISGSNAKMLSREISTTLRGWGLEYRTYPLSFSEYCSFLKIKTEFLTEDETVKVRLAWDTYNRCGAFPEIVLNSEQLLRDKILQSYYNTMLFRDLVERYNITNIGVLRYFIKRLMNNLTKPTSINSIYNDIRSQGLKISKDDLYCWTDYVCECFMFLRVPKFTASLVEEQHSLMKYYFIDNGMRQAILLPQSQDDGKLLENGVLLHLLRNAGELTKITYYQGKKECDFIVQHEDSVMAAVQVSWDLSDAETRGREIDGLIEASISTGTSNLLIITHDEENVIEKDGHKINVIPAWKFMLKKCDF